MLVRIQAVQVVVLGYHKREGMASKDKGIAKQGLDIFTTRVCYNQVFGPGKQVGMNSMNRIERLKKISSNPIGLPNSRFTFTHHPIQTTLMKWSKN